MKYFFTLLLLVLAQILFLSIVVNAQQIFTSNGEIKVSTSPANDGRAEVIIYPNNTLRVLWGNANQKFKSDLQLDGVNDPSIVLHMHPFALTNDSWAQIDSRTFDRRWPTDIIDWWGDYFFVRYSSLQTDSLNSIVGIKYYENVNNGLVFLGDISYSLSSENSNISLFAITSQTLWTFSQTSTHHQFIKFDKATSSVSTIRTDDLSTLNGGSSLEQNSYTISSMKNDSALLLIRIRPHPSGNTPLTNSYARFVGIYDYKIDSLCAPVFIDSIPPSYIDMSDRIALGNDRLMYLFRRHVPSDSIFVQTRALDGKKIGAKKYLFDHSRVRKQNVLFSYLPTYFIYTVDYSITTLPDGKILASWTKIENDSSMNVYMGLLDKDMNWIAPPRTCHIETRGDQYSAQVKTTGDTVFVVWLDTRDGSRQVYLRRFKVDEITSTEKTNEPTDFALQEIYPNPVHEKATIKFSLPDNMNNQHVRLTMYDILGREVNHLIDNEIASGQHSIEFRRKGLPSGIYLLVLDNGRIQQRVKIALVR